MKRRARMDRRDSFIVLINVVNDVRKNGIQGGASMRALQAAAA